MSKNTRLEPATLLTELIELDYLTEGLFYLPSVGPPKEVNCTDKSSPEGKTRPAMVYSYSMIDMKGQKVMMTVWDGYGPASILTVRCLELGIIHRMLSHIIF
jgi:hypothetical protein